MFSFSSNKSLIVRVVLIFVIFLALFVLPWRLINWGKIEIATGGEITVTGSAKSDERNQIATFSVGVMRASDNKDEAVSYVNQRVAEIIEIVKRFGIAEDDIKTQSISIYQEEKVIEITRTSEPGAWRASNTIEIKLRDINRASELVDTLNKTEATNVYGPSFAIDDSDKAEASLLEEAVNDARQKAEKLAKAGGRKLGRVINIVEGGGVSPVPMLERAVGLGGDSSTPVEPGTSTIYKSVSVTFELR